MYAELEAKLYEERKSNMRKSLKFIEGMIAEAECGDPWLRKQQLFGGDLRK